jgi:hypothetical protein
VDLTDLSSQLGKYLDMPSELPPVAKWNPELSGDIDMLIKSDGTWLHEGDEIKREKLVRLFSTILKREQEEYFLVTPVEKWRIKVEDQPFTVVLIQSSGSDGKALRMITNTGDEFELGPDHDVMLDDHEAPKIHVRGGMYARLNRNAFYAMAKLATERNDQFYLKSNGVEYRVG